MRLRDAKVLYAAGHFDGAYYLGGLGIECALKACIARAAQRFEFPDKARVDRIHTHRLDVLFKEAGLESELTRATRGLKENWATVRDWRVDLRYSLGRSEAECRTFLKAITGRDGVLPWLKRVW